MRTILLVSLIVLGPSIVSSATAHAQCVDDVTDAELTVRVDLTSRRDVSARTIHVVVSGEGTSAPLQLTSGEETTLSVPAGTYEYTAAAAGFDSRSGTLSLCEASSLSLQLVPSRAVNLRGTVYAGSDESAAGSDGASVVLSGRDERNGVVIRETVAADGTYVVEDVPAGFYAVEYELERTSAAGARTEHLGLHMPYVDVLDDSQLDVRLISNFDQADTDLSLACSVSGGQLPSSGALLVTLFALGFVFWRRRVGS